MTESTYDHADDESRSGEHPKSDSDNAAESDEHKTGDEQALENEERDPPA